MKVSKGQSQPETAANLRLCISLHGSGSTILIPALIVSHMFGLSKRKPAVVGLHPMGGGVLFYREASGASKAPVFFQARAVRLPPGGFSSTYHVNFPKDPVYELFANICRRHLGGTPTLPGTLRCPPELHSTNSIFDKK